MKQTKLISEQWAAVTEVSLMMNPRETEITFVSTAVISSSSLESRPASDWMKP